ncbi:MAG: 4-vinyl reductase [Chloroflexota bacterium]|nr:4-vinyl reductase [Chloroflexota bacterium]
MADTERALSGFYYPNKFARIAMDAMEEIMGRNGLNTILNMAKLTKYIDALPPDDLAKAFDFTEFTLLNVALEDVFGPRGGRAMALRAGRKLFAGGLRSFGALAGVGDLAFKVLPMSAKLKVGVPALANIFNQFSDQISNVHDDGPERMIYTMEKHCALCTGRTSDRAVCFMGQGLLMEGLKWLSGGREFKVDMSTCIAKGDDMSRFIIYKEPVT